MWIGMIQGVWTVPGSGGVSLDMGGLGHKSVAGVMSPCFLPVLTVLSILESTGVCIEAAPLWIHGHSFSYSGQTPFQAYW